MDSALQFLISTNNLDNYQKWLFANNNLDELKKLTYNNDIVINISLLYVSTDEKLIKYFLPKLDIEYIELIFNDAININNKILIEVFISNGYINKNVILYILRTGDMDLLKIILKLALVKNSDLYDIRYESYFKKLYITLTDKELIKLLIKVFPKMINTSIILNHVNLIFIQCMLENGVVFTDEDLNRAVYLNNIEYFNLLTEHGIKLVDYKNTFQLFMTAYKYDNLELAKLLYDKKYITMNHIKKFGIEGSKTYEYFSKI